MENTTKLHEFTEISLETLVPLIVLLAIIVYCLIIAAVFVFLCTKHPQHLKQSPSQGSLQEFASFMDCSMILQCLPCTACSPRRALRSCCPKTEWLRHLATCECLRPQLRGERAPGVDLVCCVVCER
ncbi:unnamed protein product [Strongylus vulgaris]|uniref:Uncharacterized protein n=1 Tax=Strongylus vulgaris TaxID=40348 RepID=A0A3P7K6J7_STRVU|nr:unnamed protein product [Strongylus vulgaris]